MSLPTQSEYNSTIQRMRDMSIKVNVLNSSLQQIGSMTGVVIGMPSFSINADSDIRRTCNVTLTPINSSFEVGVGNQIWIDKYIQIFVGIKNRQSGEFDYTNMGIYLIENPQRTYSATDNTLTFQGIDMMAKMTGLRNGNLQGMPYLIPQGSNVRMAIIATIGLAGFTKYVVDECKVSVPNDIKIDVGGTVYDILKSLRDILPNYQMYFDEDGVFHYNMIPNGANAQVMVDDNVWNKCLISYQKTTDFDSLKNSIEVYGKTQDIKNYGGVATLSGTKYTITCSGVTTLRNNLKVGFTSPTTNVTGTKTLQVNSLTAYPIKYESGTIPNFSASTYYVCKLVYGTDVWSLQSTGGSSTKLAAISSDTYIVQDSGITAYTANMTYTFITPTTGCDSVYSPKFQINNLKAYTLQNIVKLQNNTVYTIKFLQNSTDEAQKYYMFMGEVTPYGKIQETNPDSPFYVGGTSGVINKVLTGGDYDNIYTSDLALQRAKWELYTRCRLLDSVTLTCIPIYWLDVNWLVSITLPNETTVSQYLIKSISISEGDTPTQQITMTKYYPYYPVWT